jgi:hypothetical protein
MLKEKAVKKASRTRRASSKKTVSTVQEVIKQDSTETAPIETPIAE